MVLNRSLQRGAAAISAGAALIHAAEAPEHFAEWWGYGAFFVGAAVAQTAFATLLLRMPWRGGALAMRAQRYRPSARWLIAAGIIGNAAIVVLYAVTRTVGVPLVGPDAGVIEQVTRSGLLATALELVLIAVLAVLLRGQDPGAARLDARALGPQGSRLSTFAPAESIWVVAGAAILAFLALILIDALPAVIAQQEGGTGPGSALVLGQAIQTASLLVGAALAAAWLSRQPGAAVFLPSALALTAAVVAVFLNEHGGMTWIAVAHALAGLCLGLLLTAAFVRAMSSATPMRPVAMGLVLLAPVGARVGIGILDRGGLAALALAAAVMLVASRWMDATIADAHSGDLRVGDWAVARRTAIGTLVAGFGVVATLAGADSSGIAAAMLGRPLGLASLDAIQIWRSALFVTGIALMAGGAALTKHTVLERSTSAAAAGVALVALAAAGSTALLVFSAPVAGFVPGERAITIVGLAGGGGTVVGIVLGTASGIARLPTPGTAVVGAVVLAGATTVTVMAVEGPNRGSVGTAGLAVLASAAGIGAGLTLTALWRAISEVPTDRRAIGAAIGVIGASLGTAFGTSIARGDALAITAGDVLGPRPGGIVLISAALLALASTGLLGLRRGARTQAAGRVARVSPFQRNPRGERVDPDASSGHDG